MHHMCIMAMHGIAHEIQLVKRTQVCGGSTTSLDDGARTFCSKSKQLPLDSSSADAIREPVIHLPVITA